MANIDFINFKTIAKYLAVFVIILLCGTLLKDVIAISFAIIILFYAITKKYYRSIELLLIWLFIGNFFIGQGYITNEFISKYFAKPQFLLFLIFILFWNEVPKSILKENYLKIWIFFILISFLSAIFQSQSPFVIITISAFFIFYLLLQANILCLYQYHNIMNLLISVAILQTIVSILQVSEIIAPPSKMMSDGNGGQFEWVAGLDDVASGTFGPGASFLASWYAALISLLLFITWILTHKTSYLIVMAITFLQFATTDSKTIMAITVIMLGYMMLYIFKKRTTFRTSPQRYIIFILLIALSGFGFFKAWNAYYEYYGEKTGGSRIDISSVYEDEGKESMNLILENIGDWGKIRGYQYVIEDFIENDQIQLIWGYGMQGYSNSDKMQYIESKDTQLMQLNNLTNSRSGLITQFASSGFIGFILFALSIILWYKLNNQNEKNNYDIVKNSMLKIFLPFSFLAAFLYSIEIVSIPIIAFGIVISIYIKMSDCYSHNRLIKNNNNAVQKFVPFL